MEPELGEGIPYSVAEPVVQCSEDNLGHPPQKDGPRRSGFCSCPSVLSTASAKFYNWDPARCGCCGYQLGGTREA